LLVGVDLWIGHDMDRILGPINLVDFIGLFGLHSCQNQELFLAIK